MKILNIVTLVEEANKYMGERNRARFYATSKPTTVESSLASVCGFQAGVGFALIEIKPLLEDCLAEIGIELFSPDLIERIKEVIAAADKNTGVK